MSRLTGAPRLLEKQLQATCCEFLELDDWRRVRTDPPHLRGLGVSEPGICDDLFIRYNPVTHLLPANDARRSDVDVLWVEFKRQPGGNGKRALFTKAEKARIRQRGWIEAERERGALVLLVGEDCEATVDGVIAWYCKSGLLRNRGLAKGVKA